MSAAATWVKVCGLTHRDDVSIAVDAGADAIGFNLMPESPRYVSIDTAAELVPSAEVVTSVLLTVDVTVGEALHALAATGAGGVQPYGRHAADVAHFAARAGLLVLWPAHAVDRESVLAIPNDQTPLLDTPDNAVRGGTGRVFDWSTTSYLERDFVLAGGLGPDNVRAAIAAVRPWGVDASSGLESVPGRKDPGKVLAYVEEAKSS
ncbi:MAG: phosphoribosylanthranilate isomerase [Acidimicrobiia bacterium]|nr:phosphoribosylanthranilate isomerase [Acidimicrobiia bacterium]